jgi:tRNA U34 5-carboxymethylaminomethyl modifying GTPase MnmE/TrmE
MPIVKIGNQTRALEDFIDGKINRVLKSYQESMENAYKAKLHRKTSGMERRYTNLQKILDYNVDKNEKLTAELEKSNKELSKALGGYRRRTEQLEKLTRELNRYKRPEFSEDSDYYSSE